MKYNGKIIDIKEILVGPDLYTISEIIENKIIFNSPFEIPRLVKKPKSKGSNATKKTGKKANKEIESQMNKQKNTYDEREYERLITQSEKELTINIDETGTIVLSVEIINKYYNSTIKITPLKEKLEVSYCDQKNIEASSILENGRLEKSTANYKSGKIRVPIIDESLYYEEFTDAEGRKHPMEKAYRDYQIVRSNSFILMDIVYSDILKLESPYTLRI